MSDDKTSDQMLGELLEKLSNIDTKLKVVSEHPSQNGEWKELLSKIDRIDHALNDPTTGAIAKLNDQIAWRGRVDPILDSSHQQNERLLKLEMQVGLYNKITWAIGLSLIHI